MASGRLGSAVIPAKRTTVVYDNTSGGSASISIMAKMRSSTSNGTISIVLDSSATAAETNAQIDSSSYNKEAIKLFYNSGVTATTGKLEYTNYNTTSAKTTKITDFSNSTVYANNDAMFANPQWTSLDYADWGMPATHIPVQNGGSALYVRFVTPANQTAFGGLAWNKRILNSTETAPTVAFIGQVSSGASNEGATTDLYCDRVPSFANHNGGSMAAVWLHTSGTQADTNDRSSNSLMYSLGGPTTAGSQNQNDKASFASGGIVIFTHRETNQGFIVCYGRKVGNDQRIGQVIENNQTSSGASYPYHYFYVHGNNQSNTGIYNVNFFEYNPNTSKSYALMYWGDKRRLLEFDVDKWEAALAADTGATGNATQTYDATVAAGLVTDVSSTYSVPSNMLNDATRMAGPIVRVGKSKWLIPIKNDSVYTIYETTDFTSYSVYDHTANYSESVTDNLSVNSTGSVTNSTTNNFDLLDKGGAVEHDTSFNQLERTGLVISNNDRVVVRNSGSSDLSVQVMGYEE